MADAPNNETNYDLIPPEGHTDVGKRVFVVLAQIIADKVKMGLHERWFRNYQLTRGKHWKAQAPTGIPLVTANLLFTHKQRTVNTMTDNNPTFNVAIVGPLAEEQRQVLMDMQHATEHWWTDQEQQDVLETSCHNGEQYGCAIEKYRFNPDLEFNLGEAEAIPVDPFHFGFYPPKMANARDLQSREAIVHFYPVTVRELRKKYPDKAADIKADKEVLKELHEDDRREMSQSRDQGATSTLVEIASTVKELVNFLSGTGNIDDEETLLCEMWLRDRTTTKDEQSGEERPKYTGEIRYILACAGGVVLEDKDNPNINPSLPPEEAQKTWLYDKFPFSMVNSIKDTSNAWGISDFEFLEWLNMELNKSLSQFVLEKDRSARKKLINPKTSGVPNSHFTNYPGVINPISEAAAAGIRYLETPQSSVDYDKAIALFKDLFFLIAGSFDIDQAQTQGREVIAFKAIAALLERAATMMRGKIRAYSRLVRDRGRGYISMVQNFYTEERWITYSENGTTQSKAINGSKMVIPAKLTVVSGSTMPISKLAQREEAVELFKANVIDQQELLDKLDYGNRAEVIKRMQQGVVGTIMEKFTATDVPEEIVQYFGAVASADPKKLEKAVKSGEFPSFQPFLLQLMQQPGATDPAQDAEFQEKQANVKKALAEAEKIVAERDLIAEKILTEQVEQQVKLAGMEFDKEKLAMERAAIVSGIEKEVAGRQERGVKMGMDAVTSAQKNKPGWNESGMKSNNKE